MKYILKTLKRFVVSNQLRSSQNKRWTLRRDARETVLRHRLRNLR